jgi:D-beta-D-heptose 7-phosphate kinase/D-beta-D-heptose 1-phosphate adenosyltransferase
MANEMDKPVFIDPKGTDYTQYSGCTLLKPNRTELSVLTGLPARNHEETIKAGRHLAAKMPGSRLLVTEGQDGMTLFYGAAPPEHLACPPLQVYDVTGAGDTVLATLALSICAGASYTQAMQLATRAASIAVGSVGTAAVGWGDLAAHMNQEEAAV